MTLKQKATWAWIRARWNVLDARANIVCAWCWFILKFTPRIFDKIAKVSADHYDEIIRKESEITEEATAFVDTLR